MKETKKYILDKETAARKLERMAYEILENNTGENELILAGIRKNGSVIARNIRKILSGISDLKTLLIDISLDKKHPGEITLSEPAEFDGKVIILMDDVANSGKTLMYALKPFLNYHPKKIQTLVLVERSHKTFPVHPDFAGLSIATTLQEHIVVETSDGEVTGAYMQ